ncbi:E3 ubiquitin/ISG15 ligase TRIM25-like [Dendropsophus ebraccatus]|uniref:E3 ubiquitin/ISG15 ligase TRIM25-like n=1 Tax=Dendropsophus ebraccatus TaxID=150705 RepID=UPI003831DA2D
MASTDLREELSCSICLNIYSNPVTLMCGHNFCRGCIDRVLDTQGGSGEYSCPECRTSFMGRPVLQANWTLCNLAERFQFTPSEGNSGVMCTHCIHAPVPAVKFCLHCEASLCLDHLRVHSTAPEHILCDPNAAINSRKCTVHKKILEYHCSEDSTLICMSCIVEGEHRGHQVESIAKASEKKKREMLKLLQQLTSQRSEMEKSFQSLEENKKSVHDKAACAVKKIAAMFDDIRRQLEDMEKRVLMVVSRQEEHASLIVSNQIRQMETKKDELSKVMNRIDALCHMTDPMTVLQEQVPCWSEFFEQGSIGDCSNNGQSHEDVDLGIEPISNALHTLSDIIGSVAAGLYTPHRAAIILDVNTAGDHITISQNLKGAAYSENINDLPKTPERFEPNQVLSRQSFSSGTHYWDVEGNGLGMWRVGVCYPSIDRAGVSAVIGDNTKSWVLEYFINEYSAVHNNEDVNIAQDVSCNRVRICLDYEAGKLSFYELSDPIHHLHTFSATFTEPLYAAFWLGWDTIHKDSWVKIEDCET